MTGGWEEILDRMEQRLAVAAHLDDDATVPLEPFSLPPGLDPLPARLRGRAAALLEATRAEEHRLALEMGEVALRLQMSETSAQRMDRPPPSYVDTVA